MRPWFQLLALGFLLLPLPAFAQSERRPTEAEIEALLEDMRQSIPSLVQSGFYEDRRSPIERQERDSLVEAWAEVDSAIAPFLGNWAAIEENLLIFPAPRPGEVCIIDSYLDESDFYLGRVVEGKLHTDTNQTLVLDSGFLVSTFVTDSQAGHYEYASPRLVDNPVTSTYYPSYHPEVVEQFQQAGCSAGLPT